MILELEEIELLIARRPEAAHALEAARAVVQGVRHEADLGLIVAAEAAVRVDRQVAELHGWRGPPGGKAGVVREVFVTFLRLGCTSFGGPIAHLAYFRRTLVERRGWIDEAGYARIVAFCTVLPGPTSSQVGMLLGLIRSGPVGALAAWLGFTLPSALLMGGLGILLTRAAAAPPPWLGGLLDGLFAAAAAVVAQAVLGLSTSLCPDRPTRTLALTAAALALLLRAWPGLGWLPIVLGATAGAAWLHTDALPAAALPLRVSRTIAVLAALIFATLVALTLAPGGATSRYWRRSCARARSSSAAVTSCCRCCRR